MQFTKTQLFKYICVCIYICLRTYEVLEYEEKKLDKMSIKIIYNMLNIYRDVIICIKEYI
jgi:hypothetical protein